MMKKLFLQILVPVLLLSACASGPTIVSNVSPEADLGAFKTFNFMDPLGTDRSSGVRTPQSSALMTSMQREMARRGLTLSDSPDLLVDFSVVAQDRVSVRQTPTNSAHRPHWSRGYTVWPAYQTTVRQYTEGSLIIDLIDPAANRLVAEGNATNRISSTDFTQAQADDLVGQIMADIWAR